MANQYMITIKIYFTDFSQDFIIKDDYFYKTLSKKYKIILDKDNPDYLIYSCYGFDYLRYDCIKIFYTAENIRPDFNLCDYAIGFDYLDFGDRYIRFPNYARYCNQFDYLIRPRTLTQSDLVKKTGFCNFIYSNAFADPNRDQFFYLLTKYKKIDSPGKHLNNMTFGAGDRDSADWRTSKVSFQRNYKFSIAFENSYAPGYTTEKIMHAFIADTVPIYWGNPLISREFNPKAFINSHDFDRFEDVIKRIEELDNDDNKYLDMLNEHRFQDNSIPDSLKSEILLNFFTFIFSQPPNVARRRPRYGTTISYERALQRFALLRAYSNDVKQFFNIPFRFLKGIFR